MRVGLKSCIFASGHSQRQIAAFAGIPENKLSEIIRGWTDPSDRERAALIRVLGCSEDAFVAVSRQVHHLAGQEATA